MPKLLVDPSFLQSVNVSVLPRSDNAYDLGSSDYRWRNGYFAGAVDLGSLKVGGTEVIDSSRILKNIASVAQSLLPQSSGNYDLGSDDKRWRDIYVYSRIVFPNQNIEAYSDYLRVCFPDELTFDPLYVYREYIKTMNIIPLNDEIYNLGSSDYKWYNAYISNIFTQYVESGKLSPGTTFLLAQPVDADSNNALRDSPDLILRAKYWDSANAVSKNIDLGFRHIAEAEGVSKLGILFDGTEKLSVKNNGSITVYGSILPNADNSVDLGSSSYRWKNLYCIQAEISNNSNQDAIVIKSAGSSEDETPAIRFINTYDPNYQTRIKGSFWGMDFWYTDDGGSSWSLILTISDRLDVYANIEPASDGDYNLGSSSHRWKNGYFSGTISSGSLSVSGVGNLGSLQIGGTEVITSGRVLKNIASIAQSLLPTSDNDYDLGTSDYSWRKVYTYEVDLGSTHIRWVLNTGAIAIGASIVRPENDNYCDLGTPDYRWKDLYVVNLHTGDINLQNGWKITELPDGLVVRDPSGKEIFKITKDGIWFKDKKIGGW